MVIFNQADTGEYLRTEDDWDKRNNYGKINDFVYDCFFIYILYFILEDNYLYINV